MGPWKDIVEARKRRFLELYEAGASYPEIKTQLEIDEHDFRDWRDTILIFGTSRFLMAHMSKTKYSYETKLAAVKAHVEDQIPHLDIMLNMALHPSFSVVGARFTASMAKQVCNRRKLAVR